MSVSNKLDFQAVNDRLLSTTRTLLAQWLPGGKFTASEYHCSSIHGGKGDSLKVNLETGKWCDFAQPANSGHSGSDLISLYAAINGLEQGTACLRLKKMVLPDHADISTQVKKDSVLKITAPPPNTPIPERIKNGTFWIYRDRHGAPLFYISRFNTKDGKKVIVPWTWDSSGGGWVTKAYPSPRPLYNLNGIYTNTTKPILIVEGEKAADAAQKIVGDRYTVTTWSGGTNAIEKTNWKTISGRVILIWPDADDAGLTAAETIANKLLPDTSELKVINLQDLAAKKEWKGFDADDALNDKKMNWETFLNWAKPRAQLKQMKPLKTPEEGLKNEMPADGPVQLLQKLNRTKNGTIHHSQANIFKIVKEWDKLTGKFWYDSFYNQFFQSLDGDPAPIQDHHPTQALVDIQNMFHLPRLSKTHVQNAIELVAQQNTQSEPKQWLRSLAWDGISRIPTFFQDFFGADESDYIKQTSLNFWLSIAARIERPGCHVSHMIILEGTQGLGKSRALKIIGDKWHATTIAAPGTKDFLEILSGTLILEIEELKSFRKTTQEDIKQAITAQIDKYRPTYGRYVREIPRTTILAGTTNDSDYLQDTTGNRRYLPVKCYDIDIQALTACREQLFAEAIHRVKNGESWLTEPPRATEIQASRLSVNEAWENQINEKLNGGDPTGFTYLVNDIREIADTIGLDARDIDRNKIKQIKSALQACGWEQYSDKSWHRDFKFWEPKIKQIIDKHSQNTTTGIKFVTLSNIMDDIHASYSNLIPQLAAVKTLKKMKWKSKKIRANNKTFWAWTPPPRNRV